VLWGGVVEDSEALLLIQHVGMLPSMLAVMLFRLDEYTGHGGHTHATA
jgi:lysozyme family protein